MKARKKRTVIDARAMLVYTMQDNLSKKKQAGVWLY